MNQKMMKGGLSALALGMGLMVSQQAFSANWLMLQGTEPAGSAGRAKVWGFIQAQYQKDYSDANAVDGYIPPKLIGPDLADQSMFNVNRARIGVRGANLPLDSNTNYFILAEFGNNALTHTSEGYKPRLTDASITLNHIKGARIRAGMFKIPTAEEGLQAIHVFDYVNFTQVTNQMLLERFPQVGDANINSNAPAPAATIPGAAMAAYAQPVGAFRDTGVQVFDSFKSGNWETSYAVMYGNGNGSNFSDNDNNKDGYAYLSTERVFGGKGPRRQGWKTFIWGQKGKRRNTFVSSNSTDEQDRTRYGIGTKYLKKPFRVTAEYMKGKGMIFQGQHRPGHIFNDKEAQGGYIEGGWYIPNTKFEIDLRYDTYTRGENHPTSADSDESRFKTATIGMQYHFNKKTRVNMDYSNRNFESDTTAVNNNLEGVKGRFAVQLTAIY
jgi:hypothetical protein